MRHQTIEETFRAIKPKGRGSSGATTISEGFTGSGSGFSDSLSQAAQEIAQLRASYQAQADLMAANTAALAKSSSSAAGQSGGSSAGGMVKNVVENVLGGGLLGMIPLFSGIASLFGGGGSAPAPLPTYVAPPSIQLDSTIRNGAGLGSLAMPSAATIGMDLPANSVVAGTADSSRANSAPGKQTSFSPQVTVNISAMDSQSFLDRSADIASAVREAVLNLHPLNSVLADL